MVTWFFVLSNTSFTTSAQSTVYETGFNVTRDGYNFQNYGSWSGTPGHCYGVSVTSVLFYEGLKNRPGDVDCTFDIEFTDIGKIIHEYQDTWEEAWVDQTLGYQISQNISYKYRLMKDKILSDDPAIISVWLRADAGGSIGHAMVAYKIVEIDERFSRIYVYDPNYYYDGTSGYVKYLTLDLQADSFTYSGNIGGAVYNDYVEMVVVEAQLSHADIFWKDYGWAVLTGAASVVFVVLSVLYFVIRRFLQDDYRERSARLKRFDGQGSKKPSRDHDDAYFYTEEEVKELTHVEKLPDGMIICPSCGTSNLNTKDYCRKCASELK